MLLNRLRQSVAGWMAKTLIALLVGIFALWGIGDVFGRSPDPIVAKIGSEHIAVSQFQRSFGAAFNQMQQQTRQQGKELNIAQARQNGLDQQVLALLLNQAALEQSAGTLGLDVSDQALIENIRQDPIFQGPFGSFDRLNFEQAIQSLGITEIDFVEQRRKEHVRRQLITIFTARPRSPALLIDQIYKAQNARRIAEYAVLRQKLVVLPKPPADDVLQNFIAARSHLFQQKEQRSFLLLVLEPKDFFSSIKIPAARIRQEYDARIAQFSTLEQRLVQQIIFPNKKTAQEARRKIDRGTRFDKIAKARKLSQDDITLGWLTENEYLSLSVAQAAKKLRKGDVSQVVDGPFGAILLHVQDIKRAKQKSFREVKKEIHQRLLLDEAQDEIYAVHNLIEDGRASGDSLAQIAKKYGRIFSVNDLQAAAKLPKKLPKIDGLIQRVFSSSQNEDLAVARTQNNGYYWLEVTEITPAQTQTLSQVRAKALRIWQREERQKKLAQLAEEMIQKGSLGATLKSLTKQKISRTPPLARFAKSDVLTEDLVEALHRAPIGAFLKGAGVKSGEIIVLRVARARAAQTSAQDRRALKNSIRQELKTLYANELISQYIASVQDEYGLTVHQENVKLAFDTLTQNVR